MKSFKQFIEENKDQMLYHGTSSLYVDNILKHGLTNQKNYVSSNKETATIEAYNTVHGDYGGDKNLQPANAKSPVGGYPVVLHIKSSHVENLESDPEYPEDEPGNYFTKNKIPSHAIHHVEEHPIEVPKWIHSYWQNS